MNLLLKLVVIHPALGERHLATGPMQMPSKMPKTFQTAIIQLKLAKHKLELIRQAAEQSREQTVKKSSKAFMILHRKKSISYLN